MKKLLFIFTMLFFSFGIFMAQALAIEEVKPNAVINENWIVSVNWESREGLPSYTMTIDINDSDWPLIGYVTTPSLSGRIVVRRNGFVGWEFENFLARYKGTWTSRTTASGVMENNRGDCGTWTARRITSVPSGNAPQEALLGLEE